jgi:acyl-CoA synthetase (AMP-forming)/AMP-acid ligase II
VTFTARAGAAFVPVAYTEDELLTHGTRAARALALDRGETILNPFPLSGAAGIAFALMPWLASGCTLVQHEPFDLDAFAAQAVEHGATIAALPAPLVAAFARTGAMQDARCRLRRLGRVWSQAQAGGSLAEAATLSLFDIYPHHDGNLPELGEPGASAERPKLKRDPELLQHGGFAVAASELDGLLKAYPGFLDATCFAVPCPVMGDRIRAAVVAKPTQSISRDALCTFLARQGVAPYKYPERLVVVKSIPRDAQGRVLRGDLAEQATSVIPA